MKNILTTIIKTILILILLLGLFWFAYGDEFSRNEEEVKGIKIVEELTISRPLKQLTEGNGIATNIWIDEERIDNLRNHNIKYLFVDVGDTRQDGFLNTPNHEIIGFLEMIEDYEKENNYDFIILPYSEINTHNYNVNDEFKKNFVELYLGLIELGFDGIYVDIEPIRKGQEVSFLNLLEELDRKVPNDKILGTYSGVISEIENDNEWEWDINFYKRVSNRVDFIFVPGYDYPFEDKELYKSKIKEQVGIISSNNFNSYFMLGIPTHKPQPETIENALSAYQEEVSRFQTNKFIGAGIFAEWTMDENEWNVFDKYLG
jgi:hypothetical protein